MRETGLRYYDIKYVLNVIAEPRHEITCLREFPTRSDSNWPAQLQKLAWSLNFFLQKLEMLLYLGVGQNADAQADLGLCCWHMTWHVFSWPGSHIKWNILYLVLCIPTPAELSRMYPTPPSHENNNHVLSPMTNVEAPPETTITEGSGVIVKQESLLAEELSQVYILLH